MECHHVTFRSQGGSDDDWNLVLLCHLCHVPRVHGKGDLVCFHGPDGVTFIDKTTGEQRVVPRTPHKARGPSQLVDEAFYVLRWLDLEDFAMRLRKESDESLATLYDQVRQVKHRAWQAQAAIISELQARSSYGDEATRTIAKELGVDQRTVQYRGKIYRELLVNPDCATAREVLTGETWYRRAIDTERPVTWLKHAADRKMEDNTYSTRKFEADIEAATGETTTVRGFVLFADGNTADRKLCERLESSLKCPGRIVAELTEVFAQGVHGAG